MSSNLYAKASARRLPNFRTRILIAGIAALAFSLPGLSHAAGQRHAIVIADAGTNADAISAGYAARGFIIDHADASHADLVGRSNDVAAQARELMASGVEPADITIVAMGDATSTAILASAVLGRLDVNYVLIGGCDAALKTNYRFRPSGRMLSLVEPGNNRSCRPQWADSPRVSQRRELNVDNVAAAWNQADTFNAMVQWSQGEYLDADTKLVAANIR